MNKKQEVKEMMETTEITIKMITKRGKVKFLTEEQYNTLLVLKAFSCGMFYI